MCQQRSSVIAYLRGKPVRLDTCIREDVLFLNEIEKVETVGSCCGHNLYPKTLLVKAPESGAIYDWV